MTGPYPYVPAPSRPFVGRRDELRRVADLLKAHRLVTLVGGAGFGKTRLAVETLRALGRSSPDNVGFCDLADTHTADEVCAAVIRSLDLGVQPSSAGHDLIEPAARAIRQRAFTTIVLDNFEQIEPSGGALLESWLTEAPTTRFLVTSRHRLGLEQEQAVVVEPLPVRAEASMAPPRGGDAMDLFFRRVPGRSVDLVDRHRDGATVLDIVRWLEGIPLAIELAAARLEVLSLQDLRGRLDGRLRLLRDPSQGGRHATLRDALQSSWDLLDDGEQRVLRRLAVFADGFTADALPAVADLHTDVAEPILASLVAKSLVYADPGPSGARYRLFEVVREFAAERLEAAGEDDATRARHADWYMDRADRWDAGIGHSPHERGDLRHLIRERHNLEAVLARGVSETVSSASARRVLRAARVLEHSAGELFDPARRREILDSALAYAAPLRTDAEVERDYARTSLRRAVFDARHDRLDLAERDERDAIEVFARTGPATLYAWALLQLAGTQALAGRTEESGETYRAAIAAARGAGDDHVTGWALALYAAWLIDPHLRTDEAERLLREGLELLEAAGDSDYAGRAWNVLGYLNLFTCRFDRVAPCVRRALALHLSLGIHDIEHNLLLMLGNALHGLGELDRAEAVYGSSVVAGKAIGRVLIIREVELFLANLAGERGDAVASREHIARAQAVVTERPMTTEQRILLVGAHALAGDAEAAEAAFRAYRQHPAAGPVHQDWLAILHSLCALAGVLDETGTGGDALREARALADGLRHRPHLYIRIGVRALDALVCRAERHLRTWQVAPDGAWLQPPDGARCDLPPVLSRMLASLVAQRLVAPGEPLPMEALVAGAWPGERIVPEAATRRAYTTIGALRSRGVPVRTAHRRGYLLDPEVPFAWHADR